MHRLGLIPLLGFGGNNKKLLPTEPQIAQIYLSSNVVMINRDLDMYPHRPNVDYTPTQALTMNTM
jgi:hypothetical protein